MLGFLGGSSFPQDSNFLNKLDKRHQLNTSQNIFNEIELGISSGNVSAISRFFSSQTYFSLSNGINGYYSSNQAYYVLEDFFKIYKVMLFRFQNVQADDNNPYATGLYNFEFRGKRSTAQVYISLKKAGNNWKITQITIN